MDKHKISELNTKREQFDSALMSLFPGLVKPFEPEKDFRIINRLKNSSFGFSSSAFALYSNGYNARGQSRLSPCGLLYSSDDSVFSIGYFRKEGDPETDDGYMMVVCPTGAGAKEKAHELCLTVLSDD